MVHNALWRVIWPLIAILARQDEDHEYSLCESCSAHEPVFDMLSQVYSLCIQLPRNPDGSVPGLAVCRPFVTFLAHATEI